MFIGQNQRRQWQLTPVLLPGKSHGQRSPVGCSPWGLEESDTTEQLHFHFSLSCIGEGNGSPLQSPVFLPGESQERGGLVGCHLWGRTESDTLWVAQSWTRLKQLSSSSCNIGQNMFQFPSNQLGNGISTSNEMATLVST